MVFSKENGVKNTTKWAVSSVFDLLSPPLCRGCGVRGSYLCECCKKYILEHLRVRRDFGEAPEAREVFCRVSYLGHRDELLGEMVEEYKYRSIRGLAGVLAEILWEGYLRPETRKRKVILVPFPTSRKHIRERGMDHTLILAREIAKRAGGSVEVSRMLRRRKDTTQVGASEELRKKQAKEATEVDEREVRRVLEKYGRALEKGEVRVVVFDDVWTTGASMIEAGKKLRRAGVERLEGLTVVRGRRQKSPTIYGGLFEA